MSEMYQYTESGLENVWLEGIEEIETPYGKGVAIPELDKLHAEIGKVIARAQKVMQGTEVRFLRTELDLSQNALAKLLGVQENTVRRWEQGRVPISSPAQRLLAIYYLESVNGGSAKVLLDRFAETDRELQELRLYFGLIEDEWVPEPEAA